MMAIELPETRRGRNLERYLTPPPGAVASQPNGDVEAGKRTPPPDYAFFSENELPSARSRFASSYMGRTGSESRLASYTFSNVSYIHPTYLFCANIIVYFFSHLLFPYMYTFCRVQTGETYIKMKTVIWTAL